MILYWIEMIIYILMLIGFTAGTLYVFFKYGIPKIIKYVIEDEDDTKGN
jgi:hypothetical protein